MVHYIGTLKSRVARLRREAEGESMIRCTDVLEKIIKDLEELYEIR